MALTSRALAPFGTTIFATMTRLAQQHGAVNLSQGFPDFDGPEFVKDAAIAAIKREHNQYAPMPGIPSLRAALAARFTRSTAIACDPDTQVIVTAGCTEAIAACMLGLLNPGDEIILFEPFYDSYRACVAMAGATARFVALRPPTHTPGTANAANATGTTRTSHDASSSEHGRIHAAPFTFDPETLAHAITPKTRAILINTPHNPTGKVFTRAELELIASLCIKYDLIAICDEVYERLLFDTHQHISLATLPGMSERTITLSSIGKTFSFTGWKIGWVIGPAPLIASVRAAHQFLTFAVATPLQHACVEALAREDEAVGPLRALLDRNRSALCPALASLGFEVFQPEGTYFVMADHTAVSSRLGVRGDRALCMALIERHGVAAIPPTAFYHTEALGEPLVRFALCKRAETIDEAIRRLRSGTVAE